MPLLKDRDSAMLRDTFTEMTAPVRISFFQQAFDCETCDIVEQILDEVVPLGDKIELVKHNYAIDRDTAAQYGIERIPAMAITRLEAQEPNQAPIERDYGIRFYGVPSGYEFTTLIGAILDVSSGDSQLSEASRAMIAEIQEPTHIQVFTTPT